MAYNAFRRTSVLAKKEAEARGDTNNRKFPPWAATNYVMEIDEAPARLRFMEPDGDEFPRVRIHNTPMGGRVCTAENPLFGGKCVYCHYHNVEKASGNKKAPFYASVKKVPIVFDFRFQHEIETKNASGNDKTDLVRCAYDTPLIPEGQGQRRGRQCVHCAAGKPRILGGLKKWELGDAHFQQVAKTQAELGLCAVNSDWMPDENGEYYRVSTVGFACGSCKKPAVYTCEGEDLEITEELLWELSQDDKALAAFEDWSVLDYACPHCKAKGPLEEQYVVIDLNDKVVENAVRLSLYNKSVKVSCSKGDAVGQGFKRIFSFEPNAYQYKMDGNIVPFPPMPIEEELKLLGFPDPMIEEAMKPIDLEKAYRPEGVDPSKYEGKTAEYVNTVLDWQAKKINKPNPYLEAKQETATQSRSFSASRFIKRGKPEETTDAQGDDIPW